jgi:benzoylformate decarboxylase
MARVTGKEALMRILRSEGVEHIFGIPGATEVQFMDAVEGHPELRYILCLHEVVAVGMAEGYARASGKPGFLNLHTGTGLAAGLPMLSNAYYGGVPLVVTVGQQDSRLLAEEPAMSDDLVKIASPFAKWATEVIHPEDLPTIMRRAFKVAAHPPAGPVMVSLPADVLAGEFDFDYPSSWHAFTRLRPDTDAVARAAELLASAKNPVMIVEDGITQDNALHEAVRLAEQLGARVYQPWMSDVNFPVHHPQYLGDLDPNSLATRELLQTADVLLVVGALFFQQAIHLPQPLISAATKVVQIDSDPWQIAKNLPVSCGVEGDIKLALAEVSEALAGRLTAEARVDVAARALAITAEKQAQVEAFEAEVRAGWDNVPISGGRLMAEIRDALPPVALVVDDCWSYSAILRRTLPLRDSGAYMRARGGGSIGGGLPMALGAKLALPDRPVMCVTGDGSAMWSIQSLWNASHDALPVIFVVLSNAAYRQVRLMKAKILGEGAKGRDVGTVLSPPEIDFCKIAEGLGVTAREVEAPGELKGALREALASGAPHLLDVAVDPAF